MLYAEKEYPIPNFHLADFSGHFTDLYSPLKTPWIIEGKKWLNTKKEYNYPRNN